MSLRVRGALKAAFIVLFVLGGCGRIGVSLLPAPDQEHSPRDASMLDGGGRDAGDSGGPSHEGGAPMDAQVLDANMDASLDASLDAGTDTGMQMLDSGMMIVDSGMPDACPTVCDNPNGTASCTSGSCVASCSTGFSDCDSDPTNGCETNITSTTGSCGSCTNMCLNDHGTSACGAGLCTPSCQTGYADCDLVTTNGCETSLNTVTDCAACGTTCTNAHGTTSCVAGVCTPVCAAGYANCDGDPKNGCETNTTTDPDHCGSCTNDCDTTGPNLICMGSACQASTCMAGRAECDGNLAVSCETDITTSVGNCGFCSNVCTTANGTPRCTASTCQVQSCNTNYANCDNVPANGCEVNLRTNTNNCGSCGTACTNAHGTTNCATSVCAPSCSTGWGDCDSSRPNGCETQLNTTTHCGNCGNVCPAVTGGSPVCNSGVCGASCNLTGTWALKITSPTTWPNDTYIRSGSGNHVFWLRLTSAQSGTSVSNAMVECGRSVPDFRATMVSETYGFALQTSLFDHAPPYLPTVNATMTLGSTSPGASISQPLSAFLMGTSMTNPTTASWPSSQSGLTRVDMDGDGNPGVTVTYLEDGSHDRPRAGSSLFDPRAENPYIGSRLVFSLQGSLTSCTQASGPATVTRIDTHIFGCKLDGTTNKCSSSEYQFLDNNVLVYSIGSSTYRMVKVANGASCSAVRSALP